MNRSFTLRSRVLICLLISILFICAVKVSGQIRKEPTYTIPENVNVIFQTSCMPCHGIKGGRLPKVRLNFSRWAGYGNAKEAEKAAQICSSVRKGSMPPRRIRESKPELILTKEQVRLVCDWAGSLKPMKKEKR